MTASATCGCGKPVTKYKKAGLCGTCYARERRARNPQPHRESSRRYREANRDKINEKQRGPEGREYDREWKAANRDKVNTQARARYVPGARPNNPRHNAISRHGPGVFAASAAMWEKQGGKCYLCEIYLVPELAVIDHDHRCCPAGRSCEYCRRGLTCDKCNTLIGLADDDPSLLRLIADNLEVALRSVDERLARKPSQLTILADGAS